MAEEAKNPTRSNLGNLGAELDAALSTLESVLGEASHAVTGIRDTLPQIAALGEVVAELEAAMSSAYRHLSVPFGSTEATPTPTMLRTVPPSESEPEPIESAATPPEAESAPTVPTIATPEAAPPAEAEPAPEATFAWPEAVPPAEAEPAPEATLASPEAAPPPAAPEASFTSPLTIQPAEEQTAAEPAPEASLVSPETAQPTDAEPAPESPIQLPRTEEEPAATVGQAISGTAASDSLQLSISATSGSLDLKAVDRSINENPSVVDVTLLDYDGRNATLKVWITKTADPVGVREALLESFRRNFGDGQDTDVSIDLVGEQA